MQEDSKGNFYKELLLDNGEAIRVTYIKDSWNEESGIRIQIKDSSGHLRQGPEIPLSAVGNVVAEVINLVRQKK
jgi:hypothetical protein